MSDKDQEVFQMVYDGEYLEWDHAALVLEHEQQEEEFFKMVNEAINHSKVEISDLSGSAICADHQRGTVVQLHGYGYTHRKPSFSVSEHTVNLYISVQEARDMAAKLLEFIAQKEKAS